MQNLTDLAATHLDTFLSFFTVHAAGGCLLEVKTKIYSFVKAAWKTKQKR